MNMKKCWTIAPVIIAAGLFAPQLPAQDLPDARSVLDRWAEAIGGADAWTRHESMTMRGSVQMPDVGVSGSFTEYRVEPETYFWTMEMPGVGHMKQGFDGETAWNIDPMSGPRILEGDEAAATIDEASIYATLRREIDLAGAELVERTEMHGEPCYAVRIVRLSGREETECYHVDTGLRVAASSVVDTPGGEIAATTVYEEWQELNGVVVPKRLVLETPFSRMVMVYEQVEFGAVRPSDVELPEAVRALRD